MMRSGGNYYYVLDEFVWNCYDCQTPHRLEIHDMPSHLRVTINIEVLPDLIVS